MTKQTAHATQATKDSEGTKKRSGRRHTYVVTLSDEDKMTIPCPLFGPRVQTASSLPCKNAWVLLLFKGNSEEGR